MSLSRRTFVATATFVAVAPLLGASPQDVHAQSSAGTARMGRRRRWDTSRVLGVLGILGVVVAAVFFWPRRK